MNVEQLDEILVNDSALGDQLARLLPIALLDQTSAAQRDGLTANEAVMGRSARMVPAAEVDDWLRLGALDTLCAWFAGEARTCMHAPELRRPQPVWSCAWKPRLIVCGKCVRLLAAPRSTDAVCDCCGHMCGGVDAGDPITPVAVMVGPLTYQAGVCPACKPAMAVR
jgi:hypothetical protein